MDFLSRAYASDRGIKKAPTNYHIIGATLQQTKGISMNEISFTIVIIFIYLNTYFVYNPKN